VIEQEIRVRKPRNVFGKVVVADRYLAVWFVFRSKWYDLAKFYDRRLRFTGYYCDIIKPVQKLMLNAAKTSIITDLFLDLWITPEGSWSILDEDELAVALRDHAISKSLARQARRHMDSLVYRVRLGCFPPISVRTVKPLATGNIRNLTP
jgi:predicted RNA-binding protein associated with RNAse of E/G family